MILEHFNPSLLKDEAAAFVKSVMARFDLPQSLPDELNDRYPRFDLSSEGTRVASMLTPEQILGFSASPVWLFLKMLTPAVWLVFAALMALFNTGLLAIFPALYGVFVTGGREGWRRGQQDATDGSTMQGDTVFALIGGAILCALSFYLGRYAGLGFVPALAWGILTLLKPIAVLNKYKEERVMRLYNQNIMGDAASNLTWRRMLLAHKPARAAQAKNVEADVSQKFEVGKASGILTELGDGFAPDIDMSLNISANDLSTHLFIFGETGSGKTSGALRPIYKWWTSNNLGGALIQDGKGQLPVEFSADGKLHLISPAASTPYALIKGVPAEQAVDILAGMGGKDQDPFWRSGGEALLRAAAICLETAVEEGCTDYTWCLADLRRVAVDIAETDKLLHWLNDNTTVSREANIVGMSFRYLKTEMRGGQDAKALAENKTFQSVVRTVDSWISPILGHRDITAWGTAYEGGVDPAECLKGAVIGVSVSSFKYGVLVSATINRLIKARLYKAIRDRGDKWKNDPAQKPVLILIDECTDGLVENADLILASQGRSLGARMVFATQSIEAVLNEFGEEEGMAFLQNFVSMIAFKSSHATREFLEKRMGVILRRVTSSAEHMPAFDQFFAHVNERDYEHVVGVQKRRGMIDPTFEVVLGMRTLNELDGVAEKNGSPTAFQKFEVAPPISADEMAVFMAEPFAALALINRGGAPRRDIVRCQPQFS